MTPIDFPSTISVNGLRVTPRNAVARSESPFSFAEQVYDWGGEMWSIEGSLPPMARDTAAEYRSFILKLKGVYLSLIHI